MINILMDVFGALTIRIDAVVCSVIERLCEIIRILDRGNEGRERDRIFGTLVILVARMLTLQ